MKRGWDNVARPGTGAYWDQVWFVVLGAGAGICSGVSETIGVSQQSQDSATGGHSRHNLGTISYDITCSPACFLKQKNNYFGKLSLIVISDFS